MRGVSLVEALVALAVMAIGMLGVAGMQTVLQGNADNAKQRSEAVRLAQLQVEQWRAYAQLAADAALPDYDDDIGAGTESLDLTALGANTIFERSTTVQPVLAAPNRPPFKSVAVEMQWPDRTGTTQRFVLAGGIAAVPPALVAALGSPALGDPIRTPSGRDRAIPIDAVVEQGGDTSRFDPPGLGDFWRFSNDTGLVIETCSQVDPSICTPTTALVISGYIQFAVGSAPPTSADAANPPGPSVAASVSLSTGGACAVESPAVSPQYLSYYCLVPLAAPTLAWSGKLVLGLPGSVVSSTRTDDTPAHRKVCRYTPEAGHTPAGGNADHPLQYTTLSRSLANKNFLVIAAGSGSPAVAHECPGGPPAVNTYWHQPE